MKKHDEQLFEQLIRHASGEWLDEMADDSSEDIRTQNDLSFSSGFLTWADELAKKEDRRERRRRLSARLKKTGQRVAVVACILIAVCSLAAFSIPPVRVALTNLLIEQNPVYYDIKIPVEGNQNGTIESFFSFMPKDFKVVDVSENDVSLFILLENDKGETVRFERVNSSVGATIDSQERIMEPVDINGIQGFCASKNGENIITFNNDDYYYIVSSVVDKELLIKITEGIKGTQK